MAPLLKFSACSKVHYESSEPGGSVVLKVFGLDPRLSGSFPIYLWKNPTEERVL